MGLGKGGEWAIKEKEKEKLALFMITTRRQRELEGRLNVELPSPSPLVSNAFSPLAKIPADFFFFVLLLSISLPLLIESFVCFLTG